MPPYIFSISSHFVLGEAVSQTKYCYSPEIKHFRAPKFSAGFTAESNDRDNEWSMTCISCVSRGCNPKAQHVSGNRAIYFALPFYWNTFEYSSWMDCKQCSSLREFFQNLHFTTANPASNHKHTTNTRLHTDKFEMHIEA